MKDFIAPFYPSIFCFFLTFSLFMFMSRDLETKKIVLEQKIQNLNIAKARGLDLNDELKARRISQSDPDFIELLLMKKLGCTPEGYNKVLFVSRGGV